MRTIIVLLTLIIFLGFANRPAGAELTVKDFDEAKGKEIIKFYIFGVGQGYEAANVQLMVRNEPPLYCQPTKLALTPENYLRILEDTMKQARLKGQDIDDTPVRMILFDGLQKTFPCEK